MAVYTKISKKDISIINKNFNIEKIKSFYGIKKGIENTNYLLLRYPLYLSWYRQPFN